VPASIRIQPILSSIVWASRPSLSVHISRPSPPLTQKTPLSLHTKTATIPPTTTTKNTSQKPQHNHVLWLSFFFWRTSQELLSEALDVIVVLKWKREAGLFERLNVERFGREKGERGGASTTSGCRMLGRRRGFVEGDLWSLLFGRCERKGDSWAMGGRAGELYDWDVGEPSSEEKGLTYLAGDVVSCFSRSSWCTATLKRFQNWGSRTIATAVMVLRLRVRWGQGW
jgi:hypothetical protein